MPPSGDVLVVDDDLVVRQVVAQLLARRGHVTVGAASGSEGLDALEAFNPRLMVVDVNLPDTTGFELVGVMRRRLGSRMPAVVILTSSAGADLPAKAEAAGAHHLLAKPITSDEVDRLLLPLLAEPRAADARAAAQE